MHQSDSNGAWVRDIALALLDPFIWNLRLFGAAIVVATLVGTVFHWPAVVAVAGMLAFTVMFTFFLFAHGLVAICVRVADAVQDAHPMISLIAKMSHVAASGIRATLLILSFWMIDIYAALLRRDWQAFGQTIATNLVLSALGAIVALVIMISGGMSGTTSLAKKALGIAGYLSFTLGSGLLSLAMKDPALLTGAQTLFDHPLWFRDPAIAPVARAFFESNMGVWSWSLGVVPCIPLAFVGIAVGTLVSDGSRAPTGSPDGGLRAEAGQLFMALLLYYGWLLSSYLLATGR